MIWASLFPRFVKGTRALWKKRCTSLKKTGKINPAQWIFYDGESRWCTHLANRFRDRLQERGYRVLAIQAAGAKEKLTVPERASRRLLWVVTPENDLLGGGRAAAYLMKEFWWGWPIYLATRIPPILWAFTIAFWFLMVFRRVTRFFKKY